MNPMTKPEAIQFWIQVANDLMAHLPPSAKVGFHQVAQEAVKALEAQNAPPVSENAGKP